MRMMLAIVMLGLVAAPAAARSYHYHYAHHRAYHAGHYGYHHRARHPRGETCWRTNRHTGAHFRIC
jgi:hypothetical protein